MLFRNSSSFTFASYYHSPLSNNFLRCFPFFNYERFTCNVVNRVLKNDSPHYDRRTALDRIIALKSEFQAFKQHHGESLARLLGSCATSLAKIRLKRVEKPTYVFMLIKNDKKRLSHDKLIA